MNLTDYQIAIELARQLKADENSSNEKSSSSSDNEIDIGDDQLESEVESITTENMKHENKRNTSIRK
ncbi:11486_t:CDS:2 [Funneliformis caledonium]|uniref:11486_t:CDS:1 n=1 Tax=Funneliformis caledonium TaxID=1117310 RepID=A0A9N9FIQ3_9GLOM|nr:11486_t:CDS:2 [Funneliformis caledonium]